MFKTYLKQAMQMLKQNKFISTISIIGTAIAIMMVMVIIVTDEIKQVSIAPEINRNKTMYIKYLSRVSKDKNGFHHSGVNYDFYKNYLSNLKTPILISAMNNQNKWNASISENTTIVADVIKCDENYWTFMSFSFIDGKPFSKSDFDSGLKKGIISEKFSKQLFGNENALGREFELNYDCYEVVGIVKDVSQVFEYAYADVWIPYSATDDLGKSYNDLFAFNYTEYTILFLMKSNADFDALIKEVRNIEQKYNTVDKDWNISFNGPHDHKTQLTLTASNLAPNSSGYKKKFALIFCILLIIPAVNLSGFSMSRIKRRTEEIGIRKAFGANKKTLLTQVLFENFITSLIGGIIGLGLSYGIVFWLKEWLLNVPSESSIPIQAIVSFPVFLSVFVVCIILNLLSAGIPAYQSSRMSIVNSLNQNNLPR
ncbi:ABC transporter permease [Bacteroidales bacterium OttesenSCG-928-C19]|nr:ABC transporter permease [Bacteroidales bacterium OttesenSCG-928-C19]